MFVVYTGCVMCVCCTLAVCDVHTVYTGCVMCTVCDVYSVHYVRFVQ